MSISAQIRAYVRTYGWAALRQHPILGVAWAKMVAEQRRFENYVDQ